MLKVAIIGAGPLGRWLAFAAARAGYPVLLEDVMPANLHHAQEYIRQQYCSAPSEQLGNEPREIGPESQRQSTRSQSPGVTFVFTIEEAVRDADLVIDCVPDELESKLEIFWLLDRMAPPHTVLTTPTTRLSITDLAACTYRPDKCVAIVIEARDFAAREAAFNDRHRPGLASTNSGEFPAAELLVRTGLQTSPETVAIVQSFWETLGFMPRFEMDPVNL